MFDPIFPMTFYGLKVIESHDRPRYILPEELMPGIPWPPGFRNEINRWSESFLGTTNAVERGSYMMMADKYVIMRPEDIVKLRSACL